MYRRLYAQLAALIALPLLAGGCTQMTRHSNMLVFGTNTVFGVRVGTAATQVPSVDVGYTRQEAVLMPLVANQAVPDADDKPTAKMVPCDIKGAIAVTVNAPNGTPVTLPESVVNPCVLVASNDRQGARDSYSVLASFGASFGGSSEPGGATARGGLAQYFATGMAAQLLALNGGASVVAVGTAAAEAAKTPPMTLDGKSAAYKAGVANAATYDGFVANLLGKVADTDGDSAVSSAIDSFETTAGINTTMRAKCQTKAGCIAAIKRDDYGQTYNSGSNAQAMTDALAKWP